MKGVAPAEILGAGIDAIELHVFPCPVNIGLRKIKRGRRCSLKRGANGEGTGVGKSIQDRVARSATFPDPGPVVPLVKEDSLRVP